MVTIYPVLREGIVSVYIILKVAEWVGGMAVRLLGVWLMVVCLSPYCGVQAQFPMSCKTNITERTGVCCPIPNGWYSYMYTWLYAITNLY